MKTGNTCKRAIYISLGIITGGVMISGIIVLNALVSSSPPQKYVRGNYPIISPQFTRFLFPETRAQEEDFPSLPSDMDTSNINESSQEGGLPNSIFLPEIPFGGPAQACTCDCNGPIARVTIGAPSKFRWPGTSTMFMFMPYTYKHIKERPLPPSGGSQTVGKAFDVEPEPVCITRVGAMCVFCGQGDPILYVGEATGRVQPTGSTAENPWVPPF